MLELQNICYRVSTPEGEMDILRDISITIPDQRLMVFTGPNGGGKTTLAKIIMGLVQPTSGRILYNGQDVTPLSITDRARLGISYGFQQPPRFKGITVHDLLRLAAGKEKLSKDQCCAYLTKVGLCANDYLDREVDVDGSTMVLIQTSAAINFGNSGGALINDHGQVVGITSSKLVEEGYEGIGFSIPINTALPILDDLMQHGRVTGRAQLGITVVEVGSNEANYYGIPAGLRIMSINEDSDVGRQGAEVGDIITSIDGWAITSRADCSDILAQHKPGDTVEISLYRASRTGRGQTFTITVTLLGS